MKSKSNGSPENAKPQPTAELRQLILNLGCRPIAYLPAYALLPGCNVNAAVLLSQMVYWSDRTDDPEGWFYKTRDEWAEETMLHLDQIDAARKSLKNCGVLRERLAGVPARIYYRVDCDNLATLLKTRLRNNRKLDSERLGNRCVENSQTSFRKTRKLYKETETTTENSAQTTEERGTHPPSPRSVPLPPDFDLSDSNYELAERLGYVRENWVGQDELLDSFDKFRDYHQSKGTKMVDWNAGFNLWLTRGKEKGWDGA
jgi:hypothetical protein